MTTDLGPALHYVNVGYFLPDDMTNPVDGVTNPTKFRYFHAGGEVQNNLDGDKPEEVTLGWGDGNTSTFTLFYSNNTIVHDYSEGGRNYPLTAYRVPTGGLDVSWEDVFMDMPVLGPLIISPSAPILNTGVVGTKFNVRAGLPINTPVMGSNWVIRTEWVPDIVHSFDGDHANRGDEGFTGGLDQTVTSLPDGTADVFIEDFSGPLAWQAPGRLRFWCSLALPPSSPGYASFGTASSIGDVEIRAPIQPTGQMPSLFLFGGISLGYTPDVLRTGLYEDQPCTKPRIEAGVKIKWRIPAIFQDGAYIQSDIGEQPLNQQTTAPTSSSGQALYVMVSAWTLLDQYGADEWQHIPLTGQQILDMGGTSVSRFTTPIGAPAPAPTKRAVSVGGVWRAKYDMVESTSPQDLLQAADWLDESIAVTQLLGEGTATVVIYRDAEGTDELHRFSWTWDQGGA